MDVSTLYKGLTESCGVVTKSKHEASPCQNVETVCFTQWCPFRTEPVSSGGQREGLLEVGLTEGKIRW